MGKSLIGILKFTSPTLLIAGCWVGSSKRNGRLKIWVVGFWCYAFVLLVLQGLWEQPLQFNRAGFWEVLLFPLKQLQHGNFWPVLFCYIPISRCNEITLAFLRDAFDKLPDRHGYIKPPKREIGLKARVDYALMSFSELIMNFAILYSILPRDGWKGMNQLGVLDSLYYSVVTITTLGYGDIIPVSSFSKIISMYEVVAGIVLIVFSLAVYMTYAGYLISQKKEDRICSQSILRRKRKYSK